MFDKIIEHLTLSIQHFPKNDLIVFVDFLKCWKQSPDCSENNFLSIYIQKIFSKLHRLNLFET